MGDHKAHIKIELEMYGKLKTAEMSINWFPNSEGIDDRVVQWFRDASGEFREQWEAEKFRRQRERADREERELYERLKAKFEGKP